MADPLLIAKGDEPLYLLPGMSNRHGLVTGATGTGKTVTLQVMAESFSRIGVPVFAADLKDLQAMLQYGGDSAKDFQTQYGNISPASIGTIQRSLTGLQQQGGDKVFGEPALNLDDLLQTDSNGHGVVNILAADKLMASPQLYATFLLWMLSELFERLPEVGDLDKPKLVFFFDEAHLLFTDLPSTLQAKIEQVIRLIRSKGVGV